jgi:hypothetical protein
MPVVARYTEDEKDCKCSNHVSLLPPSVKSSTP